MEPVSQKASPGEPHFTESGFSFEFLLHLIDISRRGSPGTSLSLSFPPSSLSRALDAEAKLPVVFEIASPGLRKALERLLEKSSSGPRSPMTLEIQKKENTLFWTIRGKGGALELTSPLILSRPSTIRLEGEPPPSADPPPAEFSAPFLLGPAAILERPVSPEETVEFKGGGLSAGGFSSSPTGPVAVWPFFHPAQTIEFTVRWVSEEDTEERRTSAGPSEVAFSLEIPWSEGLPKNVLPRRVRVAGLFSPTQITLLGRDLPDTFLDYFSRRRTMLEESLKVFPGIELSVRFGKTGGGNEEERREG